MVPDSWNTVPVAKATRRCICTSREYQYRADERILISSRGPDAAEVQRAKELCEDLLKNVREQYEEFKTRPPQRSYGASTGYGGERGYGDRPERSGSYGGHRDGGSGGYGGYNNSPAPNTPGGVMSPTTPAAPGAGSPTASADLAAQYAQYYGGADPYAAYGGYQAYVQYYQQYMAAAAAAQQQAPPGPPGSSDAPPPPPNEVSTRLIPISKFLCLLRLIHGSTFLRLLLTLNFYRHLPHRQELAATVPFLLHQDCKVSVY